MPQRAETTTLLELIDRFLDGDHSRGLVNEIEGLVVQSFQDAEWYDDVGTQLALYAPGEGGSDYVREVELQATLRRLRDRLK